MFQPLNSLAFSRDFLSMGLNRTYTHSHTTMKFVHSIPTHFHPADLVAQLKYTHKYYAPWDGTFEREEAGKEKSIK